MTKLKGGIGWPERLTEVRAALWAVLIAATIIYFWHSGRAAFDDAEAYSAYIAGRHSLSAVLSANRLFEPGKPGLYALLTHWYCAVFGTGEVALRALSAVFALASVALVFALGETLFGTPASLIAAAIWAFNPVLIGWARWARMYTMFVALALGALLAFRKVQQRPSAAGVGAMGLLGAAMLYTHLGGLLIVGVEAALLLRDWWRGRRIGAGCAGLAITLVLFAPALPIAFAQSRSALLGHRFDWIGTAILLPLWLQLLVLAGAIALGLVLVVGPALPFDRAASRRSGAEDAESPEPLRWCVIWLLLPIVALAAGSALIHPMFKLRYIAPVLGGAALLIAGLLSLASPKVRTLGAVAIVAVFLFGLTMSQTLFRRPPSQLWRHIAATVAAARAPGEPVFFEAGYVMTPREAAGLNPAVLAQVLPRGFLRIPFDYYFTGSNPRRAINPFSPRQARAAIADAVGAAGGAWLVTHLDAADALRELPSGGVAEATRVAGDGAVSLYHVVRRRTDGEAPAR